MEIDIFSIDKKIKDIWNKKQDKITRIEEEIKELESVNNANISSYIKQDLDEKIKKLHTDKEELENVLSHQHFYTMDFSELIDRFQQIVPNKISFMSKSSEKKSPTKNITKEYLDILKKYNIQFNELDEYIKIKKKDKRLCENCKSADFVFNSEQNLEICENCGKQEEKSYKSMSYKDISRVNMSNKYTYERRIHFKDCINQYQGKQNSSIDKKVYEDLGINPNQCINYQYTPLGSQQVMKACSAAMSRITSNNFNGFNNKERSMAMNIDD
jgi:hypothetical protein